MAATFDRKRTPTLHHCAKDLSDFMDSSWFHATGRNGLSLLCVPDAEVWVVVWVLNGGGVLECIADLLATGNQSVHANVGPIHFFPNSDRAARGDGAICVSQCFSEKHRTEKYEELHCDWILDSPKAVTMDLSPG